MQTTAPDLPGVQSKLWSAVAIAVGCAPVLLDRVVPPWGIPASVAAIWLILRRQGQSLAVVGLTRPPRGWRQAVLVGFSGALLILLLGQFVYPALRAVFHLAEQDISGYAGVEGNNRLLAIFLTVSWTTAGFGEELIFRGFLMAGLAHCLGRSRAAWVAAWAISSLLFGLMHLHTGVGAVLSTGLNGALLAGIYLLGRRSIWSAYIAHGLSDTVAFLVIYTGYYRNLA